MLTIPKKNVVRHPQQVRNPSDKKLVVVIEPWAERYELKPQETIEIVFAGPNNGQPELLPFSGELVIYGWDGSEFIAFREGGLATPPPTVVEIIRQEFLIAKQRLRAQNGIAQEITMVQQWLDADPRLLKKSQRSACESAGYLSCVLATQLDRTDNAATLLWQIADRIVRMKGVLLAATNKVDKETFFWSEKPDLSAEFIRKNAISLLNGPASLRPSRSLKNSFMRPTFDRKSGPKAQ